MALEHRGHLAALTGKQCEGGGEAATRAGPAEGDARRIYVGVTHLRAWAFGQETISEAYAMIDTAAELLLGD
jgi:hypothetical protein